MIYYREGENYNQLASNPGDIKPNPGHCTVKTLLDACTRYSYEEL